MGSRIGLLRRCRLRNRSMRVMLMVMFMIITTRLLAVLGNGEVDR